MYDDDCDYPTDSGTFKLPDGDVAHLFTGASITFDSHDVAEELGKYALAIDKRAEVFTVSVRPALGEMVSQAGKYTLIGPATLWVYGALVMLRTHGVEVAVFYMDRPDVPVTQA